MDPQAREYFDEQLERVLPKLPQRVHELLREVPLYVEDHPSREMMRKLGFRARRRLCGLYTGVPLTERSVAQNPVLSDVIHIYREGIWAMATDEDGRINQRELRRQIRKTILHELGHHHGLDEGELRSLGY
jgi:predicted Zn-dependent protease with MMP-like domain